MSVKIKVDKGLVKEVGRENATRLLIKAQRSIYNQAVTNSPVDTGHLRQSHTRGEIRLSGGKISVEVTANAKYALYVHQGTKPHTIQPKTKKALSWVSGGNQIITGRVHHPGTKPQPWLIRALETVGPSLGFQVTRIR